MNPTDADIAGKLDGIGHGNLKICRYPKPHDKRVAIVDENEAEEVETSASNLLALCRAVVERVDGKNKKLQKIFNALDNHLGDTDPDILEDATDDEIRDEEPVFWAANEIAKILKENK